MDDKTKLYLLEKKEVYLIFIFMVLISATSFLLGVKTGKNFSLEKEGVTKEDRERVELLSGEEESIKKVIEKQEKAGNVGTVDLDNNEIEKQLKEEFNKKFKTDSKKDRPMESAIIDDASGNNETAKSEERPEAKSIDNLAGKYTIQIYSNRDFEKAKDFAEAFKVRGYNPIVNEVNLSGKGKWYRVSLGIFNDISEAKNYLEKEKTLFQDEDYVISKFD